MGTASTVGIITEIKAFEATAPWKRALEVGSPFVEGRYVQPPPAWAGSISCLPVTLHAGSSAPPQSSCMASSCPLLTVFVTLRRGLTPWEWIANPPSCIYLGARW